MPFMIVIQKPKTKAIVDSTLRMSNTILEFETYEKANEELFKLETHWKLMVKEGEMKTLWTGMIVEIKPALNYNPKRKPMKTVHTKGDEALRCPHCELLIYENEGGSTKYNNGVVHFTCPYCYRTFRLIEEAKQ